MLAPAPPQLDPAMFVQLEAHLDPAMLGSAAAYVDSLPPALPGGSVLRGAADGYLLFESLGDSPVISPRCPLLRYSCLCQRRQGHLEI